MRSDGCRRAISGERNAISGETGKKEEKQTEISGEAGGSDCMKRGKKDMRTLKTRYVSKTSRRNRIDARETGK